MLSAERQAHISALHYKTIDPDELEYIAFCGQSDIAHGIFRSIPENGRAAYTNKYVLHEVVSAGVKKLRTFLAASAEDAAAEEKAFIDGVLGLFVTSARQSGSFPRELFETLLTWSEELSKLSLLREALQFYNDAIDMHVSRFPDLYVRCVVGKAGVLNTMGKFKETESLLGSLARRPYRVTDRNMVPSLLFNLGQESLLRGDIEFYKSLLFQGLRHFYTGVKHRRQFVEQIRKTYRRSYRVMLSRGVSVSDKVLFFLHRLYFVAERFRVAHILGVERVLRWTVLGYVYALNYMLRSSAGVRGVFRVQNGSPTVSPSAQRHRVLITRAMGGIGDLLMMTPGLHEYKRKHPGTEIHLAIPHRYFPIFQNNPDVTLVDVESGQFDHLAYRKWFNFTDCPAARVESRVAPNVKKGRIELFARGLGLGRLRVKGMNKQPHYFLFKEELMFRRNFWKKEGLEGKTVIGVQLHSDEVYRDYPHIQQLVARLAQEYRVLVFDVEPIKGLDGHNITKVEGLPMRQAFALASACTAIVAPDSAFVHLSAAFNLPCVALFGPIDGKVRTADYPNCRFVDARSRLGCTPCWRNDKIPCKLTGMRSSVCMADISIDEILTTLHTLLNHTS